MTENLPPDQQPPKPLEEDATLSPASTHAQLTSSGDLKSRLKDFLVRTWERSARAWHESGMSEKIRTGTRPLTQKFVAMLPHDLVSSMPKTWEPMAVAEWTGHALQRKGASFYGKLFTVLLCAWFLADLSALLVESYIPEPPVSHSAHIAANEHRGHTLDFYDAIFSRNLFNSQGKIAEDSGPAAPVNSDINNPIKTTLPFNLIGTVILEDSNKSIATIEDKSSSTVYPVRIQDEIPTKVRILKIEPRKVIFTNLASGQAEYIDLPEDFNASNARITVTSAGNKTSKGPNVEQVSATQFNVARTEVDNALKDFNNILTQARAVPNFENGVPSGYKLFQIVPGSIYDKLGLKNGDTICGLNGAPINDPGKAFEMLGELKTANHMELCVKREGRQSGFSYDIR